jgi:chaperonin GroEL
MQNMMYNHRMNDNSDSTNVLFSTEARKQLFSGLKIAAEAVGCTLGPKGKTVLIKNSEDRTLQSTKDGVTVSKFIRLKDKVQSMGADLIKEAASQTNEIAGDGTTTATVLTYAMVKEGLRLLDAGYSAKELCQGIEYARNKIDEQLIHGAKKLSTSEEISQIGTISANGDEQIGQLIAGAMNRVGHDGIITVEDAKGMLTSLDFVDGMRFERGYLSPYFVTNQERMNSVYQDAFVLVTDKKISNLRDIVPLLEKVVQSQKALLIIADDVDGDALQGLVLNRVKSQLPVVAIKAPGYGLHRDELLSDICALTGAKLVSSSTGIDLKSAFDSLGKVKKFVVDSKLTTLVGMQSSKDDIETHVKKLKEQLSDITLNHEEITKLKVRIARLSGGVAIIRVGGATEIEMIERKYRIEDALNATKAAVDEGVHAGGGMALIDAEKRCTFDLVSKDELMGVSIVQGACYAPIRKIVENAGLIPEVVISELDRQQGLGYNAAMNSYVNMIESGIIDPVKVTRTALKHAASVAITFLSLGAIIVSE